MSYDPSAFLRVMHRNFWPNGDEPGAPPFPHAQHTIAGDVSHVGALPANVGESCEDEDACEDGDCSEHYDSCEDEDCDGCYFD